MTLLNLIREHRVMLIYRGQDTATCLRLSRILYEEGVRLFEVTLNSPDPYDTIAALRKEFDGELPIGAGTVLTPEEAGRAADAGAAFVVAPDTNEAMIARAKELGLGAVPGAFTPTEVVRAARAGADLVKVFPIRPAGADHIRQLRGPLPGIPLLATGGVDATLAGECVAAGCEGVGVGVQLLGDPGDSGGQAELRRAARRLIEATTAA